MSNAGADGVAALNLHEVARRVGVSAQALYKYFPSKTGLYDALYALAVRRYFEGIALIWCETPPTWDRVAAWFTYNLTFAQEQPELYQLWMERPVPGFVPSPQSLAENYKAAPALHAALDELVAAGVIRSDVPLDRLRDLLIAVLHGVTSMHLANEPDLPVGSGRFGGLLPTVMTAFESGLAPPRGASSAAGHAESVGPHEPAGERG